MTWPLSLPVPPNSSRPKWTPDMDSTKYKSIRERLGLTQAGLAARLGVSRRTIIAREQGARITEEAALAIVALAPRK